MNDTAKLRRIQELYATLPRIKCRGMCEEACGPIQCSRIEARWIERVADQKCVEKSLPAYQIGFNEKTFRCMFLVNGRCSIYEARPAICRLYGLTPKLACPFGCVPERWLDEAEAHNFLAEIQQLGY